MGELFDKNEELLNKMAQLMEKKGYSIVKDGLLYRGNLTINENGCWNRLKGNEEQLWNEVPLKIMFLMKDFTNDDMPDIRTETMRKNGIPSETYDPYKRDSFTKNILYWLYGLTHMKETNLIPFSEIEDERVCFNYYEKYPLARINCKKNPGGSRLDNSVLKIYFGEPLYSYMLREQIREFDADIILCCGGNSLIKDFVVNRCYDGDWDKKNNWIYYNSKHCKLVIDSYHPSYTRKKQWLYEELMKNYLEFVHENELFYKKIVQMMEYEGTRFPALSYAIIEEK